MNNAEIENIINSIDSMTPTNDSHDSEIYIKLLNDGICNRDDTTNIALSGPYGAGKSTILYKFKKINNAKLDDDKTKKRFLNISMASFNEYKNSKQINKDNNPPDEEGTTNKIEEVDIKAIEKSILQQMIYSVSKEELPLSKFNRISNINKEQIENKTLEIMLWLLTLVIFFSISTLETTFKDISYGNYIYYTLFIIISFFAVYLTQKNISNLYYQIKKLNLSKIVFKDTEVVFSENKNSILNSNIDEILYFFEATKTDVMIIEDLDRFNHPEIFVNLRELNYQIKNSHQVPQKVTFIYAVREDMFKNEDRVKFFDLIIPVIPFINSENSNEMISNKLKILKLNGDISKDFITGISLFISDMRLLTNIINEFLIYYSKLSNTTNVRENNSDKESEINLERLFAVIIYKNFHPDDFTKLHKRKGDLFSLIHINKKQLITSITENIQKEILNVQKDKKESNDIIQNNLHELRKAFLLEFGYKNNIYKLHLNNKQYSLIEVADDEEVFNQLNKIGKIQYITYSNSYWQDINISQIFKHELNELNFLKREQLLTARLEKEENSFDKKIEKFKKRKSELNNMDIEQLLTLDTENTLIPKSIIESEILYYLITNGYLGEDYSSYISLIHDLAESEISFLRKVKNAQDTDVIEKLNNIEVIIGKLSKKDFTKPSILNIHLVQYLIKNIKKYQNEYKSILELLQQYNDKVNDFIYFFITSEYTNNPFFINSLAKNRVDLWDSLSREFSQENFNENDWLKLILKDVDLENIYKLNSLTNSIASYIEEMPNFARFAIVHKLPIDKVKEFIKIADVKIESLNKVQDEQEKELFEFICNNKLYLINKDTLKVISSHYNDADILYTDAVSYTKLSSLQNSNIIEYIDDNINTYIAHAFTHVAHIESIESMKCILDNHQLNGTNRQAIIENMDNIFDDISYVDKISWSHLLEYRKIKSTWENILKVYVEYDKTITNELIEYLNDINVYSELKNQSLLIVDGFDGEEDDKFLKDFGFNLYFHNDLSIDSLKEYRSTSHKCWASIELLNFNAEKVDVLVNSGYLCTTPENFNNIKELNFEDKHFHIQLIEQDYIRFSKKRDQYDLSEEDIVNLLNSSKLDNASKLEIFSSVEIDNINAQVPFELTKYIISNFLIEQKDKIKLIINQIDYLNKDEAVELVSTLDYKYKKITTNKQFEVEYNDLNYDLVSSLTEKGFIKDAVPLGGQSAGRLRIRTIGNDNE